MMTGVGVGNTIWMGGTLRGGGGFVGGTSVGGGGGGFVGGGGGGLVGGTAVFVDGRRVTRIRVGTGVAQVQVVLLLLLVGSAGPLNVGSYSNAPISHEEPIGRLRLR